VSSTPLSGVQALPSFDKRTVLSHAPDQSCPLDRVVSNLAWLIRLPHLPNR
jgi:hypothetical protein